MAAGLSRGCGSGPKRRPWEEAVNGRWARARRILPSELGKKAERRLWHQAHPAGSRGERARLWVGVFLLLPASRVTSDESLHFSEPQCFHLLRVVIQWCPTLCDPMDWHARLLCP